MVLHEALATVNGQTEVVRLVQWNVRFGSKADIIAVNRHVRFTPKSGHRETSLVCPLSAKSGHRPFHSITSSARMRNDSGIGRPNVFAVLRLTTSSILVGSSTGRSAGFVPLRILST